MVKIELPFLPPTLNHAYSTNHFGRRVLSAEGKKFKNETKVIIVRKYALDIKDLKHNKPLVVLARFFFKTITNESWPKKSENRYKKLDVSNRIKLLEDALADAIGVDDSNTVTIIADKWVGIPEKTILYLWSIEEEECELHALVRRL